MRFRIPARIAAASVVALCAASCNQPSPDASARESAVSSDASQKEILDSLERLRAEMSAIRRLLERGTPGGSGAGAAPGSVPAPAVGSAPLTEADWADLERASEARLVIESVSRYRARLLPDLMAAEAEAAAGPQSVQVVAFENGAAVVREETRDVDAVSEDADRYRKTLAALSRVRSIEDLARWRVEFQVDPLE